MSTRNWAGPGRSTRRSASSTRYLRSARENDWYPHYIHNLDNLIRFGGLFPPVHVHADIRRTRLLGVTHAPHEGGVMMVRSRDDIYRMADLKGKKIGLSKSLNTIKNDWWRIQEEQGIELMLRMNGMTRKDVEIVEFPYADDWYDKPEMLDPHGEPVRTVAASATTSTTWPSVRWRPRWRRASSMRCICRASPSSSSQEATGKFKAIEDLSRYPDWTLQVANIPAAITCTDVMAEKHPELAVTFMKGMIKVGRWANEHKHAAAAILDKQTFYLDVEDTYEGIKHIDMVPNLSPQNLVSVEIGKDFMLSHGYIKNDFDVQKWAAPEFLEQAARELLGRAMEEENHRKASRTAAPLSPESGSGSRRTASRSGVGKTATRSRRPVNRPARRSEGVAIAEKDSRSRSSSMQRAIGARAGHRMLWRTSRRTLSAASTRMSPIRGNSRSRIT